MNLTKHDVYNDFFKPLRFASSRLLNKNKGKEIRDLVKICVQPVFKHMFPTKLLTYV